MDKGFLVNEFHTGMAEANKTLEEGEDQGEERPRASGPVLGYAFGAAVMVALAGIRQVFSGFWFHPAGFLLGSTMLMEYTWGSVLTALLIRWVTLRLGGAAVVRNRLMPFFVGVFLASIAAYVVFGAINAHLYFSYPSVLRQQVAF